MIPGSIPKMELIMEDGLGWVHDLFHILAGWHEIGGLPNCKENFPLWRFSVIMPFFKFRLLWEIYLLGLSRKNI
jgi:hypothetical protein